MRLLYFTDTHIRGTSPQSRVDDYQQSLKNKLLEIKNIIQQEDVDLVLHGGDVFDRPNLSPAIVGEFAKIFYDFQVPMYAVAGNHDIYGHNPATLNRTMLGLLHALGGVQLLEEGKPTCIQKEEISVQLTGQPFHFDLDRRDAVLDYHTTNQNDADYCIHIVHGMLVNRSLPEEVAFTHIEQLDIPSDVDILLTGHYHAGFPMKRIAGKYVINPGALVRVNNHISEMKRHPQVVLIHMQKNDIHIEMIPLQSAQPSNQVLDRTLIEQASYRQEQLTAFVQEIQAAGNFRVMEVHQIIEEIAQLKEVDPEVKKAALHRIAAVQEKEEGNTE